MNRRPHITRTMSWGPLHLTLYRIWRDHCNKTGFFFVSVPEAQHMGVGFQVRRGPEVYGLTLYLVGSEEAASV